MYLFFYDVTEASTLRIVTKRLRHYGHRIQKSVWLCDIDSQACAQLKQQLDAAVQAPDSVLFCRISDVSDVEIVHLPETGAEAINNVLRRRPR